MIQLIRILAAVTCFHQTTSAGIEGIDMLTIYNDEHNNPVPLITNSSEVTPTLKTNHVRFGPLPCTCQDFTCGCCANINMQLFNFQRHACSNFTYDPYEFSIGMNMLVNEESVFNRSVSGKNPPPLCMPVPIPYGPSVDQCVRIFNIFTPGRNIHMCMNWETRIEHTVVLILQFDCMRMGADGLALVKPEDEGGLTTPASLEEEMEEETEELTTEEVNLNDPVDPDKKKLNQTIGSQNKTVSNNGSDTDLKGMTTELLMGGEILNELTTGMLDKNLKGSARTKDSVLINTFINKTYTSNEKAGGSYKQENEYLS